MHTDIQEYIKQTIVGETFECTTNLGSESITTKTDLALCLELLEANADPQLLIDDIYAKLPFGCVLIVVSNTDKVPPHEMLHLLRHFNMLEVGADVNHTYATAIR